MKKIFKIVVSLFLLLLVLIIVNLINTQTTVNNKKFIVNSGDDFLLIANNLKKEEIIKDKNIFIVYAYFNGDYKNIKPGEYIFNGKYNISQVILMLKNNLGISVTIPEGFNIFQIENELIQKGIINNKFELVNYTISNLENKFDKYPFLKNIDKNINLEGFLYPNTYYFLKNTSINDVVGVFLDNFKKEIYEKVKNDVGNIYEKLILASLVEKEVYHKNDIPNVVSVIQNRISHNMLLQIDATLCYIKMENNYINNKDIECGQLTNVDKKLESSYNTYMNKGMILSPICNVNYITFKEVMRNINTDYLYYITDPETKNTIFAKTLEEHNKNIQKYLK